MTGSSEQRLTVGEISAKAIATAGVRDWVCVIGGVGATVVGLARLDPVLLAGGLGAVAIFAGLPLWWARTTLQQERGTARGGLDRIDLLAITVALALIVGLLFAAGRAS